MKNKKKILLIGFIVTSLLIFVIIYFLGNKYDLSIKIDLVDDKSPDRILTVLNDGKKFKYDHIEYTDGILLCDYNNPTVSYVDLVGESELIVVLKNNKRIKVKLEVKE